MGVKITTLAEFGDSFFFDDAGSVVELLVLEAFLTRGEPIRYLGCIAVASLVADTPRAPISSADLERQHECQHG